VGLFPSCPYKAVELWRNEKHEVPILFDVSVLELLIDAQLHGNASVSDESIATTMSMAAERRGRPVSYETLVKLLRSARNNFMPVHAARHRAWGDPKGSGVNCVPHGIGQAGGCLRRMAGTQVDGVVEDIDVEGDATLKVKKHADSTIVQDAAAQQLMPTDWCAWTAS